MQHSYHRNAFSLVSVLAIGAATGGHKARTVNARTFLSAFLVSLDSEPGQIVTHQISDLLVGGSAVFVWPSASSSSDEVRLADKVVYTFTLETTAYSGRFTTTQVAYTGSIAKALFMQTGAEKPNHFRITVINNAPAVYLNGVKLPDPVVGAGSTQLATEAVSTQAGGLPTLTFTNN